MSARECGSRIVRCPCLMSGEGPSARLTGNRPAEQVGAGCTLGAEAAGLRSLNRCERAGQQSSVPTAFLLREFFGHPAREETLQHPLASEQGLKSSPTTRVRALCCRSGGGQDL